MYSFGSNGRMNVGTMDTPIDAEYERCDSQVITDNVIYDTFSICDANIVMKTDIRIASSKVFSNSENSDVHIVSRKASSDSKDSDIQEVFTVAPPRGTKV